jgi:Type I phosphodiesterase / nucleotide pyrophosphatase
LVLVALLALSAVKVWLRPPSPRERSSAHVTIGRPSSLTPSSPPLPAATLPSTRPSTAPALSVPHIGRVVIISVDGLRPDVLLRADAPAIRALMNDGSWSMYARAIAYAYTLPAHVSMLTGVSPERHGVTWNRYIEESYPNVPTLFDLAHANGFTTAMATSKMKFITLARPGSLDWQFIADEDHQSDTDVAREAAAIVERHRPQVLFVHLGNVDVVGHATGWGSLQQVRAVHEADVCVGVVVAAMKRAQLYDSTLTILTSDHGGGGRGHGPDDLTSALIPWIAVGPGVAKNFDLTILRGEAAISTVDTFATCAGVLGIDVPSDVEGKVIGSLFHHERMMRGVVGW